MKNVLLTNEDSRIMETIADLRVKIIAELDQVFGHLQDAILAASDAEIPWTDKSGFSLERLKEAARRKLVTPVDEAETP